MCDTERSGPAPTVRCAVTEVDGSVGLVCLSATLYSVRHTSSMHFNSAIARAISPFQCGQQQTEAPPSSKGRWSAAMLLTNNDENELGRLAQGWLRDAKGIPYLDQ